MLHYTTCRAAALQPVSALVAFELLSTFYRIFRVLKLKLNADCGSCEEYENA